MKRILALAAVVALAGRANAQRSAAVDSGLTDTYHGEIRIGVSSEPGRRISITGTDVTGPTSGSLTGGELYARATNIGVYGRLLGGTFDPADQGIGGHYVLREARLLIGSRALSAEGGILQRTVSTEITPTLRTMWQGGFRSEWEIGGSGVEIVLDATVRFANVPTTDTVTKQFKFVGVGGEGSLLYQAPRGLPLYVVAGWRYERLDDYWSPAYRSEELGGPFFGIGLRFAARPALRR